MKLTKYEQETIINFNNDEQEASIYTASPQMMRKLDALCIFHLSSASFPEIQSTQIRYFRAGISAL